MDVGFQRLELFLMRNAETLFFVDNNQTEPFEFDRLGKNGGFFSPPLHDQSWPDDTIIAFQFEDAL